MSLQRLNGRPRGDGAAPFPPEEFRSGASEAEFVAVGREFFGYFVDHARLTPDECVLEVGCGIGRMAAPLLTYIERGSYDGFDVVRPWIDWCREHLEGRHPRFAFRHVDVRNGLYNPAGTIEGRELTFPYTDRSFDLVLLTSVFTHMFDAEVERYLHEIARVLRPGGRMLATFFLLDDRALLALVERQATIDFQHDFGAGRYALAESPEMAVAYRPAWVRATLAAAGLRLREPVLYGSWCPRSQPLSYQDLVLADRA